jgi:hypothetical protein
LYKYDILVQYVNFVDLIWCFSLKKHNNTYDHLRLLMYIFTAYVILYSPTPLHFPPIPYLPYTFPLSPLPHPPTPVKWIRHGFTALRIGMPRNHDILHFYESSLVSKASLLKLAAFSCRFVHFKNIYIWNYTNIVIQFWLFKQNKNIWKYIGHRRVLP